MKRWVRRAVAVACVAATVLFVGTFVYNISSIGDWRSDEVDDAYHNNDGRYLTTTILDSEGVPHIVYTKSDSLGHAWTEDGRWLTSDYPIWHGIDDDKTCCAAIGTDDTVHVFASARYQSDSQGTDPTVLVHLTCADGEWNERNVQGLPEFCKYTTQTCAIDIQNEIHVLSVGISFTHNAEYEYNLHVVYWHFDGDEWNVSKVLSIPPEWNGDNEWARVTDMAVDQYGIVHALVYNWNAEPCNVAYISSAGGEWVFELLNLSCSGFPQIVLEDDSPLIGLFESDGGGISVVAKGDSGLEELVRVDTGTQYNNFGLELAIDCEGTLHMVHVYYDEELGREVRHTTCDAGSTVTSTIYDSISYGSRPSIAVDSDGHSHVSFVGGGYSDVIYTTDLPDDGAMTDAAVDAVMKTLLVSAALAAVALMALGVLWLRRFRSWHIARFNEEPEEREERRSE